MSQWNNSYAYNQYQGASSWNGDPNSQYMNQPYYANRQEHSNQYVSFNEFLTQMQGTSALQPSTATYSQAQFENYPTNQYEYQNMPSTSQNESYNYTANTRNDSNGPENYNPQQQYNTLPDQNSYANELILKSNLTPTAMEFVPKSAAMQPASSSQNIPERSISNNSNNAGIEPRIYHTNSSETNWRERPTSSQNGEGSHKYESNGRSQENYRSQENGRNRDSNHRNNESNSRYYESNNRNTESNNRNYESGSRNQESNNRNYDSNTRSHESNVRSNETNSRFENRNEKRNQSKQNSKVKGKDSDARTFYNSSINKDSQDVRNGRSEGGGRNRNWVGSQRLKAAERNSVEDEEYANTYLQRKDEKIDRVSKAKNVQSSPSRFKSKAPADIAITEMTQRERLTEQLDKGTLECLVCCERVKQTDPVWSCGNCYHVLHLRCIRKWAMSSMVEGKWRCPACQNSNSEIPTEYRCMCGAARSPEYQRGAGGAGAHTCGKACRRARVCVHPCTLLCHPGPCPPCQATVHKQCGCGAETRSVLCSSKLPQVCGRVCQRTLECGVHTCTKECHEGPCDTCQETIEQVCYCPVGKSRVVGCTVESREGGGGGGSTGTSRWSCGASCSRVLACGAHVCRQPCHPEPCRLCPLLPDTVLTCPCGNTRLDKNQRKSCTDPIPLCGNICAKPLQCGPAGDKHFCKLNCHEGACPVCPDKTVLQCRCGHSSREVPCADLPEMYNNVLCQKKCNKKLSCGRHHCRTVCCSCVAGAHRCLVTCARSLPCQLHRCEELCHTGRCAPCPRLSFEELTCECGAEVVLPPVRCGTKPPACTAPCRRERPCGHPPHHSCHSGDCPPCVVLTAKHCHGRHEERKTIPCSQEEFSCGLPCGKPLPCGKHTCTKTCHKGPCDAGKCSQPCNEKRASCGHPCAAACHVAASTACPSSAPCRRPVRATCPCGRRHADRPCCDNSRDYTKMMSALAATKIQEGGSVDISDVQRPGNMLKTLECDDECRVEARTRRLALALQIRNPDVSAKLAPRYSDHVRTTAAREPAFALHVHDKLTDLVQLAKKSKQKTRSHSFPSMNWQKRQFIHELCEHFGCESVAYDAEPNRNVVATADKEKSWLPAMSVMEVLSREAGRRRVPPPVLRAPALAQLATGAPSVSNTSAAANHNKSPGGWATLTSTNAWAARAQRAAPAAAAHAALPAPAAAAHAALPAPAAAAHAALPAPAPAPAPLDKIDYFDNPPDN